MLRSKLLRKGSKGGCRMQMLSALCGHELGELPFRGHLLYDVGAAHKLTVDIQLRHHAHISVDSTMSPSTFSISWQPRLTHE